ncbi:MAG TPA: hypothetical protein VE991_12630, partial [Acidimicrobiales bacterium]|nr:hypothetical protein [Acidimicrobiales bacterium]
FVERARSVQRLLADHRTAFIVVSTLEAVPLREAQFFAEALTGRKLDLGAVVLNKVLPAYLRDPAGLAVAERLRDGAPELASKLQSHLPGAEEHQVQRVLHEIGQSYIDYRVVAQREAEQQAELGTVPESLVSVPFFETDVYDLRGLLALGRRLWGEDS